MLVTNALLGSDFRESTESKSSSDSMAIVGDDGCVVRLADYSKAAVPLKLMELEGHEIRAEALFPIFRKNSDGFARIPRFAIRIVRDNLTVYHRRHAGDETTLTHASAAAVDWIRRCRHRAKLEYLRSFPLILLWMTCLVLGWFFQPI